MRAFVGERLDRAAAWVDRARLTVPFAFFSLAWMLSWLVVGLPWPWARLLFRWAWPLWWLSMVALLEVARRAADLMVRRYGRGGRPRRAAVARTLAIWLRSPRSWAVLCLNLLIMALIGVGLWM